MAVRVWFNRSIGLPMVKESQSKSVGFGLMLGLTVLPVLLILDHIGRVELVYPVLASICAIGFAIRAYWELRGRPWFWVTIAVFVFVHGVLILRVPWHSGWVPASVIMGFCVVDFAIIIGVVGLIKKCASPNADELPGQDVES